MKKRNLLLGGFSGVLFLLSFPPLHLGFLSPFALALVLYLGLNHGRKEAFLSCFFSGVIFNLGLLYWIPRLMADGLYVVLALGMALLIAYLSAWVGLVGFLVSWANERSRATALLLFPFLWTAQEKARELSEMSFPWVTAGYSFGDYTRLIQFLSVGGVYFYSFVIALTAVLLLRIWENRGGKRRMALFAGIGFLLYGGLVLYGHARMAGAAQGDSLKIALVQANVDQNKKWDGSFTDSVVALHRLMTLAASKERPDLVVWSESAMPCYFLKRPDYGRAVRFLSDSLGIPLVFGGLDYRRDPVSPRKYEYFNSVFYYTPENGSFAKYDKIKLVPFSEMLPFEGLFPIISRVDLGEADFSSGDSQKVFDLKGVRFFTPICYEVVYPSFIRGFVRKGGAVMVHITNDGWFGRSGMPWQHANITRFRAVENGIPAAQCANTGVSCFIDAFGRIIPRTDLFTAAILTSEMTIVPGTTFYTRHGDLTGWFCLWSSICYLLAGLLWKRKRK